MSKEQIQFLANMDGYVSVKKIKKKDDIKTEDIIEYFASLQFTCSDRIAYYLEKLVDLAKVNKYVKENKLYDLDFNDFYKSLNSRKLKFRIGKGIPNRITKKQKKCYVDAVKIYLLDKYMFLKKKKVGYHHIVFPSKKKIMKKKVKK